MHMADALISPAVGGAMFAAAAGAAVYSVRKLQKESDSGRIPLMGVMGAFIFAAQMINFAIPGTGSSGHLAGGMLLAALLGPSAGFLTMACVLLIQALFFGDGGLLAFGCNLINLGFFSCFIAYPLIYKNIMRKGASVFRITLASVLSSLAALQMGAFGVVLETVLSGRTELPFGTFALLMQPIHLAIGAVEGIVTSVVLVFLWKARPELLDSARSENLPAKASRKKVLAVLLAASVLTGGLFSWFASANPDGLEWSMEKTAGTSELEASDGVHRFFAQLQGALAFLPDYSFKKGGDAADDAENTPASVRAETSVSGIAGGALTLLILLLAGTAIRAAKRRKKVGLAVGEGGCQKP